MDNSTEREARRREGKEQEAMECEWTNNRKGREARREGGKRIGDNEWIKRKEKKEQDGKGMEKSSLNK